MKKITHLIGVFVTLSMSIMSSAQTIVVQNLDTPYDAIADQDNNLYISDTNRRQIIKTKPDGTDSKVVTKLPGAVYGLLISNNKLFAVQNGELTKMNLDGTNQETIAPAAGVYYITSGNDGYIYFASPNANNIQRVKEDGTNLSIVASGLQGPFGITYDAKLEELYYTETGGSKGVFSIKKDGKNKILLQSGFSNPHNLRLDFSGNLYIVDASTKLVSILSSDKKKLTTIPNTSLVAPVSAFITKNGNVLITDAWGQSVKMANPTAATSLNFNGINNYISGKNALLPQGSDDRTVEAVIRVPSVPTSPYASSTIFNYGAYSKSNRFSLMLANGNLAFVGEFADTSSNINLRDDKWHHVAVTYNNDYIKLYVDGELVKETKIIKLDTKGTSFLIGASDRGRIDEIFEGDIDEIRVWNRALIQNELRNNKNCELATPTSQNGLIAYYQFNQGYNQSDNTSIKTLTDTTANSKETILNNFALTGSKSNWLTASPIVTNASCSAYVPLECTTVTLPANGVSINSIPKLNWTKVKNADDYKIFVGTSPANYNLINGTTVTSTSYTLTGLSESTTYYVKVVPNNSNGLATSCTESSFTTGTNLATYQVDKAIVALYPNPFVKHVYLSNAESISSISIYDTSGKLIKDVKPAKTLDLSSLLSGHYILTLKLTDGSIQSSKIIKK